MKLHQIHKELIRDWKPVPSVKANSFIIFLVCTELIEFLSCTLGSPKNTDPAFRLAKARHRLFPGLVRLGGASRGDPGGERNWPQSGVRQSGVGSVLIPSRSWKHHTGKDKTGLGSTRHCPTLPFLFSISSPKSGRTGASVRLVSAKVFMSSFASLQISDPRVPWSENLCHPLPFCPFSFTTSCSLLSHPRTPALSSLVPLSPLPLQLSFQWSLFLLKKRLPSTFKHSIHSHSVPRRHPYLAGQVFCLKLMPFLPPL